MGSDSTSYWCLESAEHESSHLMGRRHSRVNVGMGPRLKACYK